MNWHDMTPAERLVVIRDGYLAGLSYKQIGAPMGVTKLTLMSLTQYYGLKRSNAHVWEMPPSKGPSGPPKIRVPVPPETIRAVCGAAAVRFGLNTEGKMVAVYLLAVSLSYGPGPATIALKLQRTYAYACCDTIEERREDAGFDDEMSELEASLMHLRYVGV